MLSREDVVEIVALHRRGWSVSAIARHTGRDRKTVRAWLRGERDREARREPSSLEPFRAYVVQRLGDDPHLDATVLLRELRPLGFVRSYPTLTRELRRLGLRPMCEVCRRGGHKLTIELEHEPGEELQLDWLELPVTPWGEPAHVLVGALSHSGRIRAVLSEGEDFAQLVAALDGGGGGRAGEALRGHDRGLPAAAGAARGRGRGRDPVSAALLVAQCRGGYAGRGASLARPLGPRSLRRASPRRANGRRPGCGRAAAAAAAGRRPGRAAGRAGRVGERAGRVRGQPLQRPAESDRSDGDRARQARRADAARLVSAADVLVATHRRLRGRRPDCADGRAPSRPRAGRALRVHDPPCVRAQAEPATERRGGRARRGVQSRGVGRARAADPRRLRGVGGGQVREQGVYQQLRSHLAYLRLARPPSSCPRRSSRPSGRSSRTPASSNGCSRPRSRRPNAGGSRAGSGSRASRPR